LGGGGGGWCRTSRGELYMSPPVMKIRFHPVGEGGGAKKNQRGPNTIEGMYRCVRVYSVLREGEPERLLKGGEKARDELWFGGIHGLYRPGMKKKVVKIQRGWVEVEGVRPLDIYLAN